MEILESLEMRWFLSDKDPCLAVPQGWFESITPEGKRIDDYLLTGRDDIGFKARGVEKQPTRIELKYLVGTLGILQVAPGVVGKLEHWSKLSMASDDHQLKEAGTWCAIEKGRRLRKFAFQHGEASEVPVESRPVAGCGVELTQLLVKHSHATARIEWTLGFEAFGPERMLLEIFQATCRAARESRLVLELGSEKSMGYPQWLASVLPTIISG
jgi:hypothetical protein